MDGESDDVKYGFQRPEMYSTTLSGTVDAYDRHVFLCFKEPESWASHVEKSDLPSVLATAVKSRKDDITVKTKITICAAGEGTGFSDGDVLIFPDMIKYGGLKEADMDSFVEDVFINCKPWGSGVPEMLTGTHVFVCAHGSRDKRCGVCGPVLIDRLKQEIDIRGLVDQVYVSACSHIGGHKYAGNLIIYGPNPEGKITGHWYGYVAPDDVPEVLDGHIGKGEVIERLWRGQMGVHPESGGKGEDQKLPNGTEKKKKQSKEKHEESTKQDDKETTSGCCQGVNGVSCCRDGSVEKKSEGGCSKGLRKLSSWTGTWEQGDVLAATAVVAAVATVAVAYTLYRRSA